MARWLLVSDDKDVGDDESVSMVFVDKVSKRIHKSALREAFQSYEDIKVGKISVFRAWVDSRWQWRVPLRRNMFDWEMNLWNDFMRLLENVRMGTYPIYCVRWAKSPFNWKLVYEGLTPYKVDCEFTWSIWSRWCSIWGIHFVLPRDGKCFLLCWIGLCP
ncbi:hypothetical protein GQ457_13G019480 [Hibiscus cannabinus]